MTVLQKLLQDTYEYALRFRGEGKVADYIPELEKVDAESYGIFVVSLACESFGLGDCDKRFSIQSIAKVLSLSLAMTKIGDEIWERTGVEPSGNSFNSLVQLEYENGIPRNPMINAGAIVICDILITHLGNPLEELLAFTNRLAGSKDISYNPVVAESERSMGFRNYALANFLKSFNNLNNRVEEVLDLYFHLCSIEMSCRELAHAFAFVMNGGFTLSGEEVLSEYHARRLNSLMLLCGFYDESGEFAFKVGMPGKSGVGGGIVAVQPGKYSVSVWGPRLNNKGNSVLGLRSLEYFAEKTLLNGYFR